MTTALAEYRGSCSSRYLYKETDMIPVPSTNRRPPSHEIYAIPEGSADGNVRISIIIRNIILGIRIFDCVLLDWYYLLFHWGVLTFLVPPIILQNILFRLLSYFHEE